MRDNTKLQIHDQDTVQYLAFDEQFKLKKPRMA